MAKKPYQDEVLKDQLRKLYELQRWVFYYQDNNRNDNELISLPQLYLQSDKELFPEIGKSQTELFS